MKNVITKTRLFLLIPFIILGMVNFGCQELEKDVEGTVSPQTFFQTEDDLNAVVTAAYNSLLTFATYTHGQMPYFGGDDMTTQSAGNKAEFRQYDQFAPVNTNGGVAGFNWSQWWKMVLVTNTILDNYQSVDASQEFLDQAAGQAQFLRGLAYYFLVRTYGEVPLLTSTNVSGDEELASFEALYAQIIQDFTDAKNNLPDSWGGEPGRPTTWVAQSYLASAYLTSAGFPVKNTSNYALAATEAKNVIDNGPFSLLPNYQDVWSRASSESDNNVESVFAVQFCATCGGWGFGNFKQSFSKSEGEEGGWDDIYVELQFFNDFPAGPRKDATFTTVFPDGSGGTIPWQNNVRGHPYYAKWRGVSDNTGNYDYNNFDINQYLMRYSEVLLIHAEARIMANGNTDAAGLESLNQVKRRAAGLPSGTPDVTVDVTSATQAEIVDERAWEFAGEYSRWFDMIRTEIISEVVAKRDPADLPILGTPDESNPWALIPAADVALNPNLEK